MVKNITYNGISGLIVESVPKENGIFEYRIKKPDSCITTTSAIEAASALS